jgi:hypothetical protein
MINWERRRLRNRVIKGLELAPRGGVAKDRLQLRQASLSLSVEWQARDIHPWDGDLPLAQQTARFTRELMTDTLVAIRQLFDDLAEVDVIQIRVCGPNEPDRAVLAGTVCRNDLNTAASCPSPAMSLRLLGIQPHLVERSL